MSKADYRCVKVEWIQLLSANELISDYIEERII